MNGSFSRGNSDTVEGREARVHRMPPGPDRWKERSLRNFLSLRSSKRALWEMRELAWKVFAALPDDHQFIFADCMEMTHENL